MAQKYIYWKWSNGGILKQSLRETNKNAKIQEHSNPIQEKHLFYSNNILIWKLPIFPIVPHS